MKRSELKRGTKPMARTELRRTRWVPKRKPKSSELERAEAMVRLRSRGLCEVRSRACTNIVDGGAHHILRRSQGGKDHPFNLLDSCRSCHRYLHDHPAEAYERGWLMHSWEGMRR